MHLSANREVPTSLHGSYQRAGQPHKTRLPEKFSATWGDLRGIALRRLCLSLHKRCRTWGERHNHFRPTLELQQRGATRSQTDPDLRNTSADATSPSAGQYGRSGGHQSQSARRACGLGLLRVEARN